MYMYPQLEKEDISYQGTVELFNHSVVMTVVMVVRDLAAGSSLVGLKL